MRRLLVLVVLTGFSATGCSTNPRQCATQVDCFGGEQCANGECVALSPIMEQDVSTLDVDTPAIDCRLDEARCGGQVCNVSTGNCEACQRDLQCGDGGICDKNRGVCTCGPGFHACGGDCVRSDSPLTCGTSCAPCPDVDNASATCVAGSCGFRCDDGYRPCDGCGYSAACIECASDVECGDPAKPFCNEGQCGACTTDAHCSHLPDTKVCDGGQCVECAAGKTSACEEFSCDLALRRCTETPMRSLDWCEACVADSECKPGQRCVPMKFSGTERAGGYCLEQAVDGCSSRATVKVERDSLSGVYNEFYCTIREDLTTCEAVLDYLSNCDQDSDCGTPGAGDAYCKEMSGRPACTYPCTDKSECSGGGASCIGAPPAASYCHLP